MPLKERNTSADTKLRIVDTLETLMQNGPLEKVKVSSLCKQAGVSRTTFYEYFCDVFAVPTWLWDNLMGESLYQMGLTLGCYQAHLKKFKLLLNHQEFFRLAFKSDDFNSVFEHGSREVKERTIHAATCNAGRPLTNDELLKIEFRNAGSAFMTRYWIMHGMQESPEEMADLFLSFTPQFLVDFLEPQNSRS